MRSPRPTRLAARPPRRRASPLRPALVLAAVLALTAGIGVSSGAIPSGSGTIHGCFAKSGGSLRVVDKAQGQGCKSTERSLDWNAKGAAGAPGISAAFEKRGGNTTLTGTTPASANAIATLPDLAPGAYVVHAKVNVTGPGTTIARVVCEATLGDTTDEGIVSNGSQGGFSGQQSIKMQLAVATVAKASATLRCYREGLVGGVPFVSDPSLIALRVGALTTLP